MSEPWLRVFAADMRGDPEMALVGLAGQAIFVHAWDIAKHGPVFGELREKTGKPYTPETLSAVIPGATPATARRWWRAALDRDYAQQLDDGALYFPALAKRQGYDPTNTARQARFRKRRRNAKSNGQDNGRSNAPANSDVTGQSTEERREAPSGASKDSSDLRPQSPVDRIWKTYEERHPTSKLTAARRDLIRRRLQHYDADELILAITGNHLDPHCNGQNDQGRQYHSLELILRDAAHIEQYAELAKQANGTTTSEDIEATLAKARDAGWSPAHA